jgi:DNA-directed RNA polymerase subunit F
MALVMALTATACSSCKSPSATATDAGSSATGSSELTPQQAAEVLARVGDRTITLGDFEATIARMDTFDRMRYQAPERRKELLSEMIDVMLLADQARADKLDQDPETQQEVRQILRDAVLKKAQEGVPKPDAITDAQVAAYYDAHKADFHDPERRRVSAIVLPTAAAASAVLAQLKATPPARFGELVRSKSVDPLAKANVPVDLAGDMGFVSPPGDPRGGNTRFPEEVRVAVFGIANVGDVAAQPVAAGGKFWIVKLAAKTDPHDRSLQDAERTIRVKLAQDAIHAAQDALIADLKTKYPVKIDEAALATVKVELPAADAGVLPR